MSHPPLPHRQAPSRRVLCRYAAVAVLAVELAAGGVAARAQEESGRSAAAAGSSIPAPSPVVSQALDDAWWTGPMLAPSAATLPRGHFLIEPYLYDVTAARSNGFGTLSYVLYGLADRLTAGLMPTAGFNVVRGGPSSSGAGVGDVSLIGQYRLTQFQAGGWMPTTSVAVLESLPSGRYDRLGDRPSDGLGSGAYTTTLALYAQTYLWLPNDRILRLRLDLSGGFSNDVKVEDVSVYGTAAGFRGHARPGNFFAVDPSWEYSLTRSWVLALDVPYRHGESTRVSGFDVAEAGGGQNPSRVWLSSGPSDALGFAPAIEYSWKPNLGVLAGVRVIAGGRNTAATLTPAVAINIVL
jgi:hypothetical protein